MSTLENRPNTALLVVDVQNGVVAGTHGRDAVVANIGKLVGRARQEQVPVVWVQHSDEQLAKNSDEWRIVPELTPDDAEPHVDKSYADSFEDTALETVLAGLDVGRLVVVGAQTDECIRSTLHGALVRGYDATLVSDAHTTEDLTELGAPPPDQVITHTNLYWTYHKAPGRTAGTSGRRPRQHLLTRSRAGGAETAAGRRRRARPPATTTAGETAAGHRHPRPAPPLGAVSAEVAAVGDGGYG